MTSSRTQIQHGLTVQGLSKNFWTTDRRKVRALHQVSLNVRPREFVSIIGPSGCGKSTLLNLIAGLDRPDEGTLVLNDRPITGPSPRQTVVFQQFALFPWMSVAGNIESGLRFTGLPREARQARVSRLLEIVGLADFARAYPKELSGGMKQRVAIARAYALEPELLLMDEPFGSLDAQTRMHLQLDLLETWSRTETTVVFVTHDVDEAVFLASRVIVMANAPGRIDQELSIDLPYPRPQSLRTTADFFRLRTRVWEAAYGISLDGVQATHLAG